MMDGMYAAQAYGQGVDRAQNRIMTRFDTDGSGDISTAEAGEYGRVARQFTQMDADGDGRLTGTEVTDHLMMRAMEGRGPMGPERMNAMAAWMQMQQDNAAVARFDTLDTNADAALSDGELTAGIEAQEAADAAAELRAYKIAEMHRMDLDNNGQLSVDELQAELNLRADNRAVAAFDAMDLDGDGMLSDAELAADIIAQMPPPAADDVSDTAPDMTADDMSDMAPVDDSTPAPAADPDMTDPAMTAGDMPDDMAPATASDMTPDMAPDMAPAEAADTAAEMAPVADTPAEAMTDPVMADAEMAATDPVEEAAIPAEPVEEAIAATETTPEMTAAAPEAMTDEAEALSLIENVFETMLDDSGLEVSMDKLVTMSQSLYTEAQEILMDSLAELGSDDEAEAA